MIDIIYFLYDDELFINPFEVGAILIVMSLSTNYYQ